MERSICVSANLKQRCFVRTKMVVAILVAFAAALLASNILAAQTAYGAEVEDELNIAVVNFQSSWGNIEDNVAAMEEDIAIAADDGVNIIVFPEMSVTGYVSTDDAESQDWALAVENAEAADGETATAIAQLAAEYNMWIIYGNTEAISGDEEHAYNSAFICSPEGEVTTYQTMHPLEGDWCVAGTTPAVIETEWGNIGISMSYDTYASPELERYYAAQECRLIVNPTASAGGLDISSTDSEVWQWYFESRVDNIAIRDGIYVASANLTGDDGYNAVFPGGSTVIGPSGSDGTTSFQEAYIGSTDSSEVGVYSGTIDLSLATATDILESENFQADLYAAWYEDLADDTEEDLVQAPETDEAVISTVNFQPTFGNKEANYESMKAYIEEAAEAGTNILVFPELALTGYAYTSEEGEANGQAIVDIAETTDGEYATKIAELAQEYDMYIVFGTAEAIEGNTTQAYNSAFVAEPDGTAESYRKIAPVEGPWCASGTEPLIVETECGSFGISICKDTYAYPELARYYMAKGCTYLINPTARTGTADGWEELYINCLENAADQNKMIVISADLCGADLDVPEEQASWDDYSGASGICAPLANAEQGSNVYTWGSFESDPEAIGLITATIDFSELELGLGAAVEGFNAEVYAALYDELAGGTSAADVDDGEVNSITPIAIALLVVAFAAMAICLAVAVVRDRKKAA